jgi:glycosyltransferase involved in cell wall biosynthesis
MTNVVFLVENESVPRDRRVWMEARALADAGCDVTVIGPKGPTYDREPAETIDGVRLLRYPSRPAPDNRLSSYGVEYVSALLWMMRLLRRVPRPIDVIHVANPPDLLALLGVVPKMLWGTRVVYDQHDLVPELFESRFGRRGTPWRAAALVERLSYRLADRVVVTNESYHQVATDRGGKADGEVSTVRNAPDVAVFNRVAPDPDLRRGRPHLGVYVGVIGPQDGVDVLMRILHVFRRELGRDDLQVAVVGDGDALGDCRRLATELGLDDMVDFAGWQSTAGVLRYLSTADVALAPDPPSPLNDRSTMVKVIEYQAVGLPIVSFDLRESVVSARDAAVYASGGDEREFARLIADLLDDPQRRLAMGRVGMERAAGPLSWEVGRSNLLTGYEQMLSRPLDREAHEELVPGVTVPIRARSQASKVTARSLAGG